MVSTVVYLMVTFIIHNLHPVPEHYHTIIDLIILIDSATFQLLILTFSKWSTGCVLHFKYTISSILSEITLTVLSSTLEHSKLNVL